MHTRCTKFAWAVSGASFVGVARNLLRQSITPALATSAVLAGTPQTLCSRTPAGCTCTTAPQCSPLVWFAVAWCATPMPCHMGLGGVLLAVCCASSCCPAGCTVTQPQPFWVSVCPLFFVVGPQWLQPCSWHLTCATIVHLMSSRCFDAPAIGHVRKQTGTACSSQVSMSGSGMLSWCTVSHPAPAVSLWCQGKPPSWSTQSSSRTLPCCRQSRLTNHLVGHRVRYC